MGKSGKKLIGNFYPPAVLIWTISRLKVDCKKCFILLAELGKRALKNEYVLVLLIAECIVIRTRYELTSKPNYNDMKRVFSKLI